MTITADRPTAPVLTPRTRPTPLRLRLLGRAAAIALTAPLAIGLFTLWVTLVAVSPLTVVAPLVLPATWLVRRYADAHRRSTARLVGRPLPAGYRDRRGLGVIGRVVAVVRDPASVRDLAWLAVHAVIGWFLALLSLVLAAGAVFYAIYPFLYRVTPYDVFGRPFGGWIVLHSQAESFWFTGVGVVLAGLWWVLCVPLARAEAALSARLLTPAC